MQKRILYLNSFIINNKFTIVNHGYEYNKETPEKKSGNVPTKHLITDVGYIRIEEINKIPHNFITPTNFFISFHQDLNSFKAIFNNLKALLDSNINQHLHLIILDIKTYDFLELLKEGESVDGLKYIETGIKILEAEKISEIIKTMDVRLTFEFISLIEGHIGKDFSKEIVTLVGEEEREEFIFDVAKYWKPVKVAHPLITAKQIFYDPLDVVHNNMYKYITINYKEEIEVGRSLNTPMFASIHLPQPIETIELFRTALLEVMGDNSSISTIRLEVMNQVIPLMLIRDFGKRALIKNKMDLLRFKIPKITVGVSYEIASMINPPGLARKAIDNIVDIDHILLEYRDGTLGDRFETIDITTMFYDIEKNIIKPDIPMSSVMLKYKHKDYTIPLFLTNDLPSRNHLKRVEKQEPKLTLVLHHDENSLEYYIVIELKDGSNAIYTAFYSNRIMKKALKKK